MPKWRNWQTRRTQNPVSLTGRVGSNPTFGTKIALLRAVSDSERRVTFQSCFGPMVTDWSRGRGEHEVRHGGRRLFLHARQHV